MRRNRLYEAFRPQHDCRTGFTLIELLVVIAIIVLLVAILLPALQAAKKQSEAVVCQSKLRQWGLGFAVYTSDHEGLLPYWGFPGTALFASIQAYWPDSNELLLCPLATRYVPTPEQGPFSVGSTYYAWYDPSPERSGTVSSYGLNGTIAFIDPRDDPREDGGWRSCLVKRADKVPVILDCRVRAVGAMSPTGGPPPYEDAPYSFAPHLPTCMWPLIISRHSGGTNGLFMDWSVRKVGLKEHSTLKWQKSFDTRGPWTKAGGVKPEDWPAWIRKFRDY